MDAPELLVSPLVSASSLLSSEETSVLKKIVQMGRADVVAELSDAEHGMREFISRDLNGFWITFGQALPAGA